MATDRRAHEGARIISALEQMWGAVQAKHPEVPDAVVITGTGTPKKSSQAKRATYQKLGHLAADRWVDAEREGRRPELFIAGELLDKGGAAVLETMLHEGAHALASARGILDCGKDHGRWHNKKFAELAKEMGLQPPLKAWPTIGFSEALITPATTAAYQSAIRRLETARLPFLDGGGVAQPGEEQAEEGEGEEKKGGTRAGKRGAVTCRCDPPRRMQVTPKVFERGAILCGECAAPFTPEKPEVFVPKKERGKAAADPRATDDQGEPVPSVAVPAARAAEPEAELDWEMEEPPVEPEPVLED